MEDNRKFATFFADAPKGKKIGAVLSWIATVILLVALFVPGYQLRYQMKTEKGTFKDIPATMTSELKQMKEAAKLNFQFGAGTTSDKIDEFVEKGSTSVFSYLVSPDLQKARLVNLETMSDASDDISKICVAPWLQKWHVRGRRENSGQQYSDAGEWYVYHARKRNLPVQKLSRESIRTG